MPTATKSLWSCDRCGVSVSWATGRKRRSLPDNWVADGEGTFCLACRREMAGEAGTAEMPDDASGDSRRKADVTARIEFELSRDPSAADGQIAKACRTSVASVRQVRQRLGAAD